MRGNISIIIGIFLALTMALTALAQESAWQGSWSASPQPAKRILSLNNQTIRQVVHISQGGAAIRLRLSNLFGNAPLHLGAVFVGLRKSGAALVEASNHPVLFNGSSDITLAPGQEQASDAVDFPVANESDLAVSLYFPEATPQKTFHSVASDTVFISSPGNVASSESFIPTGFSHSWFTLTGIDVQKSGPALVTLGDSITDGVGSTPGLNARWPDRLSDRLLKAGSAVSVLNQGIGYNRVLNTQNDSNQPSISALERFSHDALHQPGVRYILVFEGINDIGMSSKDQDVDAFVANITGAYYFMIQAAHQQGIKVIGATLTQTKGSGYYSAPHEAMRTQVNDWIRTSKQFDGLVDFDLALHDPSDPERLLPAYDSGDHLHPSDLGFEAMAAAVDLSLFNN